MGVCGKSRRLSVALVVCSYVPSVLMFQGLECLVFSVG